MSGKINAASVALIADERVLLIARARLPHRGLWTLPGGRLEAGETAAACAVREVHEELGLVVAGLRKVMRLDPGAGPFVLQVFATRDFAGDVVAADEVADWRWVTRAEAAGMATTPGLEAVLERAFAVVGG